MEKTYVHLWLIHDDVWQKPAQYYKKIILQLKINLNKKLASIETVIQNEFSQREKKQVLCSHTSMWNLENPYRLVYFAKQK